MPNIGGKIWFTAIAGLLLGFVLFGMLQRGCDASGQATVAIDDRSEPPKRDYNAASRNNTRTITPSTSSNNSSNARGRRSGARNTAKKSRGARNTSRRSTAGQDRSALERNTRSRSRADAARKAELARLTRERTARYRERSARAQAGDPNILDPALRTSTTGASTDNAVAQAAAEAGNDLRGQRGEGGSGSGGSGPGEVGGAGQGRGADGDGGPGDSGEGGGDDGFAEIEALLEGLGLDQSFVDLIRQVVTGNTPPTNPFVDNSDPDNGNDETPTIPVDTDPVDPVDLMTPVLARWVPIENDACRTLGNQGLETRDLYLAFLNRPIAPPVLSSTEDNSIVILDGTFYQAPLGTNGPPTVAVDDCIQFDSYLSIGKVAPVFLSAPDPANWGNRLLAEWFAISGAEITQDRAIFGNDRFYVHIGRFTAESEAMIFGSLRVDFAGQLAFVDVPDWQGASTDGLDDQIPPPLPEVDSIGFTSSGILAGNTLEGTVVIDRPAPAGGLLVSLSTDKPGRISLPLEVFIPEGESDATFEIRTIATGVVENATITAFTPNSLTMATLRLEAPALISFEPISTRLLDGQTTSAVILLGSPADEGGTTITLRVGDANAISIPSSVRIPAGHRRTVVRIKAEDVGSVVRTTISATAGGVTRSFEIEVVPTLTLVDANDDGVVDTADLGMLLGAFGSDNPLLDFNGDGVVDTADLGMLQARFGDRLDLGGDDGPDDNPDGGSDEAVIAKWIDVSQDNCDEFPGSRTVDLYIGFLGEFSLPVISSDSINGIQISGGDFLQHPFGGNSPPEEIAIQSFPCLAYDSYLTIGGSRPAFLGLLDTADWTDRIITIWFSTGGEFEQNPSKFGDTRQYLHIGRFTASSAAIIAGSIRVDYAADAPAIVDIPDWATTASLALDLNFDGQVDSIDVAMVVRAYGTINPDYDFDGDGIIDGDDLRPLLDMIQQSSGL